MSSHLIVASSTIGPPQLCPALEAIVLEETTARYKDLYYADITKLSTNSTLTEPSLRSEPVNGPGKGQSFSTWTLQQANRLFRSVPGIDDISAYCRSAGDYPCQLAHHAKVANSMNRLLYLFTNPLQSYVGVLETLCQVRQRVATNFPWARMTESVVLRRIDVLLLSVMMAWCHSQFFFAIPSIDHPQWCLP